MSRQTLPPARRRKSPFAHRRRPRSIRLSIEGLESRSLLSTLFAITDADSLLTIDSANPGTVEATTAITGLPVGETIVAVDILPTTGAVIGLGSQEHLYTINLKTGAATAVNASAFTPALVGTRFSIDANPVTGLIRLVDDSGQNLRISPTTGTVTASDARLGYALGDPNAGTTPNVVAVAHTSNRPGASSTTAYAIDSSLGALVTLGSIGGSPTLPDSGQLATVGSLGVNITNAVGFDIVGASDTAYAALTPTSSTTPALYTINLATGAATTVGTIGDGSAHVIGLAASTLAPPPTLATASDSGVSNTDHITNVKTPVIQGTALAGAGISILANGVLVGTGTADASGNYSITTSTLADGTYTVQVLQTDASGLTSGASAALSPALVIDTVAPPAPSVPTLFPQDDTGFSNTDNFTRDNVPQFFGTGEANATVSLFTNGVLVGQAPVGLLNSYSIQSSRLADGVYQATATQSDVAGNVSPASAAVTPPLTIDTSSRPAPAQAYVGQLYLDILGRPVDQGGLGVWTPLVTQPNGRATVVAGIQSSVEARQVIARQEFVQILHRSPDANTAALGANFLLTHTDEQFLAYLAGTDDYFHAHGSTNASFLTALYPDLLGRPIDASGRSLYLAQLGAGAPRSSIALEILASNEYFIKLTTNIYEKYLHRAPDPTALSNVVNLLNHGGTDEQVVTILATSNEYFQDARGSNVVVNQWGRQVYLDLLGQPADAAGLASLTALLDQNDSPSQAVAVLQNSDAYRGAEVTNVFETILRHAPGPDGLTAGIHYLNAGGTIEGLKSFLYGSTEYYQNIGGNTNSGFLSALYQGILGRSIDPGALSNGLSYLAAGGSRSALASYLESTNEGVKQTVQTIYMAYLRRYPTFDEINANTTALMAGAMTDQSLIAALIGSPEYFSKL
jgi:hypothetical protein